MEFPSVRAGALALKERLPSLFAKLIQTNIPSLKASALAHIDDTREQRRRLGDAPLNTAQMISEVQRVLLSPSKEFSETITPFIENFREDVHATEKRVTLEWVGKKYKHDAFKRWHGWLLMCNNARAARWAQDGASGIIALVRRLGPAGLTGDTLVSYQSSWGSYSGAM